MDIFIDNETRTKSGKRIWQHKTYRRRGKGKHRGIVAALFSKNKEGKKRK